MSDKKLESFERGFSSGFNGIRRTCNCGWVFYLADINCDWEEGEYEELQAMDNSTPLDYHPGGVVMMGAEYCNACTCWEKKAEAIVSFIEDHIEYIRKYLALEKARKESEAKNSVTL